MGTIFEELIRRFNEALDENPGEHFTPRDVVHLMVDLMLAGDEERIAAPGIVRSVYDPCCGSGGMLMIAKEHIAGGTHENGDPPRPAINPQAEIHLFGQEVNPETWAVSKSDIFIKDPSGRDADKIAFGSNAIQRPPYRPNLRLPNRQSALRQGLEARQGHGRSRTRTGHRLAASALDCRASATVRPCFCSTCSPMRKHRTKVVPALRLL